MSREDRRPLPQLPEDSVNTDMYSLAPTQESFTLNPSYNPTEPYFFDNLAYCPDISASYLSHYSPTNLSHHQPTDAQNLVAYGAEHSLPFVPNSDAVFHILDPSTAALDLGAFATLPDFTLPDHFPEFFKDVEYCQELQAVPPTAPVASNMNMPSMVKRKGRRKSQPVRFPSPPVSGFDSESSNADELSPHDKNRLYLESLDCYVQHLQQLFNFIGVEPLPLELAENYGGLSCRSVRTIVFHLEKTVDALRGFVIQEEDKFEALGRGT